MNVPVLINRQPFLLFVNFSTGIKLKPKTVMSKTEEEEALLRERNLQLHEWSSKFRVCVCLGVFFFAYSR
tara:strand:+ start:1248 stop:1457 length:210 start_codon:yes stop_codon:yes gene_type:complete